MKRGSFFIGGKPFRICIVAESANHTETRIWAINQRLVSLCTVGTPGTEHTRTHPHTHARTATLCLSWRGGRGKAFDGPVLKASTYKNPSFLPTGLHQLLSPINYCLPVAFKSIIRITVLETDPAESSLWFLNERPTLPDCTGLGGKGKKEKKEEEEEKNRKEGTCCRG